MAIEIAALPHKLYEVRRLGKPDEKPFLRVVVNVDTWEIVDMKASGCTFLDFTGGIDLLRSMLTRERHTRFSRE